ncbi:electron transfer flavoprotein subunit alpha/FixB family protein [Flavobacteriaceae bacterium]|nr:electron transfer flavoprotein subunit alpha/FixB family protein [Flavobacteriaceae bacterium]MDC0285732.1 electron transfer flavoprotein subunit alpha/FixB family protein [Candidatus Poseidoniaceae archaeon]MDA7636788.1 electron transfer flavoprotein subunit alpha/FixB family protein [Flavobacteriaceae bacterium]MDA9041796.1 electron transfer flavoprotein subunit alpha/FixB family protein [Flavobacteriaceae bacterium]MDA9084078.1 electron transfer flavoprotein subunit alpha/FixB family prot|tara:strand:+ start:632 stop:1582 length:951 start_codon:yes stop_codon:yes gene_type:complete
MAVLVYIESEENKFKKTAYEALSYGKALADKMGVKVSVLVFNCSDTESLKKYGADKIIRIDNSDFQKFSSKKYSHALAEVIKSENSSVVILSSSPDSKFLGAHLSGITDASYVSNVVGIPESISPFVIKRTCFTNKAFSSTEMIDGLKIISVSSNSFGMIENFNDSTVESFNVDKVDSNQKIIDIVKETGSVTIADADIVVSAGRGLKGPENWEMIETLADTLGAATACSKPVSDMGWRPHSEHVGQTGKPVSSNLYIAIGISGAIQHLAGINSSKIKVVINSDPEAPFFKAADYGVVGDAFEVIPELIQKLKDRQ